MWLNNIYNVIIIIIVTLLLLIYFYFKWCYQYWLRSGVPYLEPQLPYGNLPNPFKRKKTIGIYIKDIYDEMKSNKWHYGGIYSINDPTLLLINLNLIRNIMTKDFNYFIDRGVYYNEKDDPLSAHLFAIGGIKWRKLRTKLTPTFTSGKMRQMFQTILECEQQLTKQLHTKQQQPIDIKEIMGCFTTDIIGSVAFGLEFQTFNDRNSPFRRYGKRTFQPTKYELFKSVFGQNFPKLSHLLRMKIIPDDVSKFFLKIVKDTVKYREIHNYTRKDFIQILIDMKNNHHDDDDNNNQLTIDELAAQCFIFFLAGFETSSTTMTFALYELAQQPHLQQKVRNEIHEILKKYNNQITYDAIKEMKYMNQVINETLRKYPPLPFVTRQCIRDYQLTNNVTIKMGTHIIIPILGIHNDPDLYPNPEKFDPERFRDDFVQQRHQYAHIPFGEGPRICIGLRFGMVQTKVGLTSILRDYKIKVNPRTQQPIQMAKNSFILAAEGDIWLDLEKISAP